ncbi:MAG: class I SAM-dependent methyltransferase [Dehalococcoidia bacterium]
MTENPFRPEHFRRIDEGPDDEFYEEPRLVTHIDDAAIAAAGRLYAELLPRGADILDLMSSWRSHLPESFPAGSLVGLGMNDVELSENRQLTQWVTHDLNFDPHLPFESDRFDGAIVTVSVQYLTRPLEVFAEVHRVLRPSAPFIVTFSNRCFPTKAIWIWRSLNDLEHAQLIASYFQFSGRWTDIQAEDRSPRGASGDPLYAVYARKASNG